MKALSQEDAPDDGIEAARHGTHLRLPEGRCYLIWVRACIMVGRSLSILVLGALVPIFISQPSGAESTSGHEAELELASQRRPPRGKLTRKEKSLLRRPDEKLPERQLTLDLLGRPLSIGWTYEIRSIRTLDAPFSDRRVDDRVVLAQAVTPNFFYRFTDSLSLYAKGSAFYRSKWKSFDQLGVPGVPCWDRDADNTCDAATEDRNQDGTCTPADCTESEREENGGFQRREIWLYAADLMGTPVSLQFGQQRVFENREWWWDEELDSFRIHYDRSNLHLEVLLAQLLARLSTDEDHIDPEQEDVLRLMAHGTWQWARKNRLELFVLRQWDRSETEAVDQRVDFSREDPSDADLTWLGLSARGRWKLRRQRAKLYYWLDSAVVRGRETSLDFGGRIERRVVDALSRHDVRGWGLDLGATWEAALPGRPSFTIGYAIGSGDSNGKNLSEPKFNKSDLQEIDDRSFRQTGMQDNNTRFRGVDRFKYYGELLDPELSNLRIGTVSIGFRLLRHSSVELLYHLYRQVEPAKFLRDATIRRQPAGLERGIGSEVDLVVGIEEWEHVEIELIGSAFRAGSAFGAHCDDDHEGNPSEPVVAEDCRDPGDFVPTSEGDWSYLALLKFKLNF